MYLLLVLASSPGAKAHSSGQTGRSTVGCSCHGAAADATTSVSFGAAPATVLPGEVVPITLTVSSSNGSRIAAGLDVSVTGGTFAPGATGNTKVSNGEITHPTPEDLGGGQATFDFLWTAPAVDGTYTFHGVGNAVNLNGVTSGDAWNLATDLIIEVDSACDDLDGDGFDTCEGDCDDTDPTVSPDGLEICDGIDNDCNGTPDDGDDAALWYPDADLDGFGDDDHPVRACTPPFNHLSIRGDCDDANAAVYPGATEICDAGDIDQDCNGTADDPSAADATPWYTDGDDDGYGAGAPILACDQPPGRSALDGDCDDADPTFNPGAVEDCADPNDLNCDGATGLQDNDNDGYPACEECNDANSSIFPGAFEVCDQQDDDCDGNVDEDAIDGLTWYRDDDGDGHGVPARSTEACVAPVGFVASDADCDDTDPAVSPDAAELWYDGIDQTCDGNDDDQDGDGVPLATDCIDTDPATFPGAEEIPYDGIDGDCAGDDDFDRDGDGHPAAPPNATGDDCNDGDGAVYPGASDPPCDDIDLDCNPVPDTSPTCDTGTGDTGEPPDQDPPPQTGTDSGKEGCACATSGSSGWVGLLLLSWVPGLRRKR